MFGGNLAILAMAALATLSAGGIAYALLYGRIAADDKTEKRIGEIRSRKATAEAKARVADVTRRRKSVQDTLKEIEERQKAKAKLATSPPLNLRLQQAGLNWTKNTFIVFSLGSGLIAALLCWLAGFPLYAVVLITLAGGLGFPRWLVNFWRKRRFKAFVAEFPNAVDVIVRGVRAGLPLNDCLRIIAREVAEPVKSEFRVVNEAQAVGLTLAEAVERLPERLPIAEAKFFAIALAIQQQTGGNLTEALANLSRVLRERKKMKGKIGAMSMEAKASAVIIGALPIVVMVLVYMLTPDYISLLFTEPLGNVILLVSAFWMSMGVLVMRRMINFDY